MLAGDDSDSNSQVESSERIDSLSASEIEELARMVFEQLLQELEIEYERTGKKL